MSQYPLLFVDSIFTMKELIPTEALEGHLLLITYYLSLITYCLSLITYYLFLIISFITPTAAGNSIVHSLL